MGIVGRTPLQDGFRMPARFSPHERSYMAWPEDAEAGCFARYFTLRGESKRFLGVATFVACGVWHMLQL